MNFWKWLPFLVGTFVAMAQGAEPTPSTIPPGAAGKDSDISKKPLASVTLKVAGDATPNHCPLTVTLKNTCGFHLVLNTASAFPLGVLTLTDKGGSAIAVRGGNDYLFGGWKRKMALFVVGVVRLEKDEEKSWTIDLAQSFPLESGEYTVAFSVELDLWEADEPTIHAYRFDYAHVSAGRQKFSVKP